LKEQPDQDMFFDAEDKGDAGAELRAKLKKKEAEIKKLRKEFKSIKELYLRIAAEKDNLRKRLEREKTDYFQFALSEILKEFLSVLDNFERALGNEVHSDCKGFQDGIEMIYKQYMDVIKKQGVEPIEIEEGKFDPRHHQAFITEESDSVTEPEVSEELQKGYLLHERLLRPSLVKVLLPKKGK
jgi:molecular chaperone GrpE